MHAEAKKAASNSEISAADNPDGADEDGDNSHLNDPLPNPPSTILLTLQDDIASDRDEDETADMPPHSTQRPFSDITGASTNVHGGLSRRVVDC